MRGDKTLRYIAECDECKDGTLEDVTGTQYLPAKILVDRTFLGTSVPLAIAKRHALESGHKAMIRILFEGGK